MSRSAVAAMGRELSPTARVSDRVSDMQQPARHRHGEPMLNHAAGSALPCQARRVACAASRVHAYGGGRAVTIDMVVGCITKWNVTERGVLYTGQSRLVATVFGA